MTNPKTVYISAEAHRRLKVLSARRNLPMGKVVESMVEAEIEDLANPWTAPEGLNLQERALLELWEDPDLDVYADA
jgi:hypothetical protein